MKKVVSLLLVFCMLLGMSVSVFARGREDEVDISVRIKFDGVDELLFDTIKVKLVCDGETYDTEKISASSDEDEDWRFVWEDLDKEKSWSVEPYGGIDGYTAEVENYRGIYWVITVSAVEKEAPADEEEVPVSEGQKPNPGTGAAPVSL